MTSHPQEALQGLTSAEARRRLEIYGRNLAVQHRPGQRLLEFAKLLLDPMAIMLAVAAVAYLLMGERLEGAVLLAALVPVLGIDVILEIRSQTALKKLATNVEAKARVIRDAREQEVPSEVLVPEDLLLLREGDIVHADATVVSASISRLTSPNSQVSQSREPSELRKTRSTTLAKNRAFTRVPECWPGMGSHMSPQ